MLLGIQIVGVLFALFMLYLTFLYQKRKEFGPKDYIFWILLWICFITITLFPNLLTPFAETLNLQRTMDLLIILGMIFVIGMLFTNYILLKKTQKRVEELIRRMAYKELKK